MKRSEPWLSVVAFAIPILTGLMLFKSCHVDSVPNALTVVKQRGMENYGYVTHHGFVFAGYTNVEDARKALKEYKWHYARRHMISRHPKPISIWEPQ